MRVSVDKSDRYMSSRLGQHSITLMNTERHAHGQTNTQKKEETDKYTEDVQESKKLCVWDRQTDRRTGWWEGERTKSSRVHKQAHTRTKGTNKQTNKNVSSYSHLYWMVANHKRNQYHPYFTWIVQSSGSTPRPAGMTDRMESRRCQRWKYHGCGQSADKQPSFSMSRYKNHPSFLSFTPPPHQSKNCY